MDDFEWDPLDADTIALPLRVDGPCVVTLRGDLFAPEVGEAAIDRAFSVMALCPEKTFRGATSHGDRMCGEASGRALRVGGRLMDHAVGRVGVQCHVIGIVHEMTFGGLRNVEVSG